MKLNATELLVCECAWAFGERLITCGPGARKIAARSVKDLVAACPSDDRDWVKRVVKKSTAWARKYREAR